MRNDEFLEEPESRVIGGKLVPCMWIHTKAVICTGQKKHARILEPEKELRHRNSHLVVQQFAAQP